MLQAGIFWSPCAGMRPALILASIAAARLNLHWLGAGAKHCDNGFQALINAS
jgi:hypothetical protein